MSKPDRAVDMIQQIVSGATGLPLTSQGRREKQCKPRQIAMYLIHKHTGASLQKVAGLFGKKQHGTAKHAITEVQNLIDTKDRDYYKIIRHAECEIELEKRKQLINLKFDI